MEEILFLCSPYKIFIIWFCKPSSRQCICHYHHINHVIISLGKCGMMLILLPAQLPLAKRIVHCVWQQGYSSVLPILLRKETMARLFSFPDILIPSMQDRYVMDTKSIHEHKEGIGIYNYLMLLWKKKSSSNIHKQNQLKHQIDFVRYSTHFLKTRSSYWYFRINIEINHHQKFQIFKLAAYLWPVYLKHRGENVKIQF